MSSIGATRMTTANNCYVSMTIPDSLAGIMEALTESSRTMQLGGGIGYDFSTLRPRNALITKLQSPSSGPISFMQVFDAMSKTISSAGNRRGAQMGILRVDHPDIEEFVHAKTNGTNLTQFNISVGITDKFMNAVIDNTDFDLVFEGTVYKTINAQALWHTIMRNTWHYGEPGVVFLDTINRKNNLWYVETICATNPCGEQPLPPHGACLLGSINLTKYVMVDPDGNRTFDLVQLHKDIPVFVRAMDNVVDVAIYPLPQQEEEARNKRRMGIGVTGLANCMEYLGFPYGSESGENFVDSLLEFVRDNVYQSSIYLAKEKGSFPLYTEDFLESGFCKTLPEYLTGQIKEVGIRNSHLLSMAPTGTISLIANNVSSGIEPVFNPSMERTVQNQDGSSTKQVITDYAFREWGVIPVTADEVTASQHVRMLNLVSKHVDSAASKTCNVADDVPWEEFMDLYMQAWKGGASGCTTFSARAGNNRGTVLAKANDTEEEGAACYFDEETGRSTCD